MSLDTILAIASVVVSAVVLWIKLHVIQRNHLDSIERRLGTIEQRVARIEGRLET